MLRRRLLHHIRRITAVVAQLLVLQLGLASGAGACPPGTSGASSQMPATAMHHGDVSHGSQHPAAPLHTGSGAHCDMPCAPAACGSGGHCPAPAALTDRTPGSVGTAAPGDPLARAAGAPRSIRLGPEPPPPRA